MLNYLYKIFDTAIFTFNRIFLLALYKNNLKIGRNIKFRKRFNLTIINGNIIIGNNVFFNNDCSINCLGLIRIGDDCLFGECVKLYDHDHIYMSNDKISNQGFNIGTIEIGKNCWIGSNVIILKNVKIGDHVVIGANCLIYKDIPSNTIIKSDTKLTLAEIK